MLLLDLPTELLIIIFSHVGSSYFLSDMSRLTVCKLWAEIARTTCFRHLQLSQELLLACPHLVVPSIGFLQHSVETLTLNTIAREYDTLTNLKPPLTDGTSGDSPNLNEILRPLAIGLRQTDKVRRLCIKETSIHHSDRSRVGGPSRGLDISTISAFLSPTPTNLTTLDLDLWGPWAHESFHMQQHCTPPTAHFEKSSLALENDLPRSSFATKGTSSNPSEQSDCQPQWNFVWGGTGEQAEPCLPLSSGYQRLGAYANHQGHGDCCKQACGTHEKPKDSESVDSGFSL
ncbi:hypothetical protein M011DRAFT_74121 [Sporormia fimetaria CBS 119925]|uniref:Uncharacterized protein n=1 Tax=Sporormia fimetaria CBS 119925 TaxID=1340428 RepID=A0A6A6V7D1_9PLEO|nr:hypothetical protein M011DRAFT_74121 [Sporormia fimetaria CBS 119925]